MRTNKWIFNNYGRRLINEAYLILDLAVHNYDRFKEYVEKIHTFISKHCGRYVVQGIEPTVMEGDWNPERVVVLEFPPRDKAKQYLGDPEAQSLFKIRHTSTTRKLILVDGCF